MYIHSFRLIAPRRRKDARQYRRYEEINNIPDRLRWCRNIRGLSQREAALRMEMAENIYKAVESGDVQMYPRSWRTSLPGFTES